MTLLSWQSLSPDRVETLAASLVVLSLLAGIAPAGAQPNYLQNGSFDSDVSSWTFDGNAGQTLEWDNALGFPDPGSLRLSQAGSASGAFAASECIEATPGSSWTLDVLAREEPGSVFMSCAMGLIIYTQPDCAEVSFGGLVNGPQLAGNDWTQLSLDFEMPAGHFGIQAILGMSADQSASGACNFDSVRLTGPPNFAEVPALGPYTLATLIAALALAGLFWLRRAH